MDAAQATLVLEGELCSVQELGFAFKRAASRLVEMSGEAYHKAHAQAHADEAKGSRKGAAPLPANWPHVAEAPR